MPAASHINPDWHPKLEESPSYDLLVAGGGPSGLSAALAAARAGFSTLLVEANGQLGGMGVSGMVSHWLGGRTNDTDHWVVGGIFRELSLEAAERGIAGLPRAGSGDRFEPYGWNRGKGQLQAGIPFDPFAMAALLEEKLVDAGVNILYHTRVVDVLVADERITHGIIHNKSGFQAVPASVFVDATGDADVAEFSGCPTILGREEDRLMTPVTLQCHMENIDREALSAYINENNAPRFLVEIEKWREEGVWNFSYNRFISVQLTEPDTFMINTPRLTGIDGTDGESLSRGMIQGRKEILELLEIMRAHIPGCANARIKAIAPAMGVRETRRIVGDFQLTVQDLVDGVHLPDTIGFTAYGWDLPDPKRPSYQPMTEKKVKKKEITPIPYRVMVPKPIKNLICPGRAVWVERDVLGPMRVQAPCMAMGQAAGLAAAQVLADGSRRAAFASVDTDRLRAELKALGALVDSADIEAAVLPAAATAAL